MATVTMYSCSNEKYKRIASKDSKVGVGKKSTSITQQTKKKNSLKYCVYEELNDDGPFI